MFLCPKCGKHLFPVQFKEDKKRPKHYFECECGWTNKDQVLKLKNKKEEDK